MPTKPKNKSSSARRPPATPPARRAAPPARHVEPPALLIEIVRALDAKKAEDLRVLHVGAQSSITDWLLLATGGSEPHLRALRIEVERVLDAVRAPIAGTDGGTPGSGWTVVDAYQIMVHLFTPAQRAHYALERLWRDAVEIPVASLLPPPPKPPAGRRPAAKRPKPKAKGKTATKPKKPATPARRRKHA